MIFAMLPGLLFGLYEKHGQPLEVVIGQIVRNRFLMPRVRPYQTMLADFLNTENGVVVNLHVRAIDQTEAIKTVKRKITDLDAMKIQEQKKAVRSGYDMDILPSDLATYGTDAKQLLSKLQTRNERLCLL